MRRASILMTTVVFLSLLTVRAQADRNCGWQARLDSAVVNTLYPDQFANYWILALPAVDGATLTLHGAYPHARYMSFVSYAASLQSADGLPDVAINADPGSENPFTPGNARTTDRAHRLYTVTVRYLGAGQTLPTPREANTLYTSNADGSKAGRMFTLIYRVYRADRAYGADITGGMGLPRVTVNAPDGTSVDLPECAYQEIPPTSINDQFANAGGTNSGGTLQHPGFNPPVWHKFQNFARSLSQGLTENGYWKTAISDALHSTADKVPPGGFADNPDNNYIFTLLSHGYGQIAVFQAKLPVTPQTYLDAPVMPSGTELRYWSMCSNDGPSQRFLGCVMDDGAQPDANGRYTIVVSTLADRPATAKQGGTCGCVWLPWGPGGSVVMIMRNMLPSPTFKLAIQNVDYGKETDLGAYYPVGCYMTSQDFDKGTRC